MTEPKDSPFDDFSIERLLPPTEATRAEFEENIAQLLLLADRSHMRVVGEVYADEHDTHLKIACEQVESINPAGQSLVCSSSLRVVCYHGDEYFSLSYGNLQDEPDKKARLEKLIDDIAAEIEDDSEAKWIKEACYEAQNTENALLNLSVEKLLRDSPFHVGEIDDYVLNATFNNGAVLTSGITVTDEEYAEGLAPNQEMKTISLIMPDGTRYEYTQFKDGTEKLFVSRPNEQITSSIDSDASAARGLGHEALSQDISQPAFEETPRTHAAASAEADLLGMTKLTDGTLQDFNRNLQGAISSGLKIK